MQPRWEMALITGASSGIGEAFARALDSKTGLILTGRNREALDSLAAELSHPGRTIVTIVADLSQEAGREAIIRAAQEHDIDLFVNNAGLGWMGDFASMPMAIMRDSILVNVLAPVGLAHALLAAMIARARQRGKRCGMIVVASTAAFLPIPYSCVYAATKAFDLHFAEALAEEKAEDPIDILALCPGATRTSFFKRANVPEFSAPMHSPERVAREGLQSLGKKRVHIVGTSNRLAVLALHFLPRAFFISVAKKGIIKRFLRR